MLPALIADVHAMADEAERRFGHLSPAQLNWKPSPSAWSVAQCLRHLISINVEYFPALDQIARGEYEPSLWARLPFLPALFGRLVLGAVQPDQTRRARTRPKFDPAASTEPADVVAEFRAHQEALAARMAGTGGADLDRVVITSPIASVVTYTLRDACRIIVAHERRHLAQAERVTATPEFPAAGPSRGVHATS